MSSRLRNYLLDVYERRTTPQLLPKNQPIQIDDQDDYDNISQYCTIFVQVLRKNRLEIELAGAMPITREMADLAEIYDGYADTRQGRMVLYVTPAQIDLLLDLSEKIKKTAFMGNQVGNPNWHRIAARTISSLQRFVRTIREYERLKGMLV